MSIRCRLGMAVMVMAAATFLTGGCVVAPRQVRIAEPFDAELARQLSGPGLNTVKGSALIRQAGGGVVTCAGQTVYLVPSTGYAQARLKALYGNNIERAAAGSQWLPQFIPDPPEYKKFVRSSVCDAQGYFVFDQVADGDFYVNTVITWLVGNSTEGGSLLHHVAVRGGQTVSIVLAP